MIRSLAPLLASLVMVIAGCRRPDFRPASLVNAGFEQALDSGWTLVVASDSNTRGYIERSDTLGQPGSGFAVRLYKFHKQFCSLSQVVPVETLDQVVRFWARFRIGANVPCTPVAAVAFDYLASDSSRLGRTVIYLPSSYCTWTDSDTLHLVRVTDTTGQWAHYSVNLRAELDSFLPGVPQDRVTRLRVEAFASVDYSG